MSNKQIGILSAGAWGTAIGKSIAEKGHSVQMWDFMEDVVKDINKNNSNNRFLYGVKLPENLKASTNIEEVVKGKDFLIIATPSLYIIDTIKKILHVENIMEGKTIVAVLTKGFISSKSGPRFILESLEDYLPGFYKGNIVYISGPSHAEEVARGKITGLISACDNGKNSIKVRELLNTKRLMVFASIDTRGVQVCAAVKNVIAIAYGMLDALKELSDDFGDNTESLLLAAGLNEIQLIGKALGSTHPETFTSIAGVGDLDVTCRSKYGRNRKFGSEIVSSRVIEKYKNIDDIINHISDIGYLPEGAVAAKFVKQIMDKYNLKLQISQTVFKILNRETEASAALEKLIHNITGYKSL